MNQNDLAKLPKQFCENVVGGFTNEFFIMVPTSGSQADLQMAYAFTPQHAKRFLQWLSHTVENYEKQYGKINADWKPGVESPIQISDLRK